MVFFTADFREQLESVRLPTLRPRETLPQFGAPEFDPVAGFPQPIQAPQQLASPQFGAPEFDPVAGFPQPTAPLTSAITPPQQLPPPAFNPFGIGPAAPPGFQGPIQPVTQTTGPTPLTPFSGEGTGFGEAIDKLTTPFDAFSQTAFQLARPVVTSPQILIDLALGDIGSGSRFETLERSQRDIGELVENLRLNPVEFANLQAEAFRERPIEQQLAIGLLDPIEAVTAAKAAVMGIKAGRAAVRQAPDIARGVGRIAGAAEEALGSRLTPGLSTELGAGPFPKPNIANEIDELSPLARQALFDAPPPLQGSTSAASDSFDEVVRGLLPGEKPAIRALENYGGQMGAAGQELRVELRQGNQQFRDLKIGQYRSPDSLLVSQTDEMEQLFRALHGNGLPPARLEPVFDDLKRLVDIEQADTLARNPDFPVREDYFFRGWREVDTGKVQGTRGGIGATPGFAKPRVDATFDEILQGTYTRVDGTEYKLEPVSWNPYEMVAIRREAGVRFREQQSLIEQFKALGIAQKVDGPVPDGFRVPRVGPAFEGKPYAFIPDAGVPPDRLAAAADIEGARIGFTGQWMVEDDIANRLENIYGAGPALGKLKPILTLGQRAKRLKLFGSLFQQVDFATRGTMAEWGAGVNALRNGQPIRAVKRFFSPPKVVMDNVIANLSPGRRAGLQREILSGDDLFEDIPGLSLKSVAEAGWSQQDITLVPREIRQMIDDIAGGVDGGSLKGAPLRKLKQLNGAIERGLFEGVYPQAQVAALKHNIIPGIVNAHPNWSVDQIAASAAAEVNKLFSTLSSNQQLIQNANLRAVAHSLFFSTNETESLLRQFGSIFKGNNKALWADFYIGGALFLAVTANVIHFATTGKPLPINRYAPIKGDDRNFFGVNYNGQFLSPDVPIKGRGGVNVALDLVGQMDTALRILDPASFVQNRFNVLPRALESQRSGEDFFGRDITESQFAEGRVGEVIGRTQQALIDLGLPIGAGQGLEAGRQLIPGAERIIPEGEGRLGALGVGLQGTGINLRAETTPQLLDRKAQEAFGKNFNELLSSERKVLDEDEEFQAELQLRTETAAERGSEGARRRLASDALTEAVRTEQQLSDDTLAPNGVFTSGPGAAATWRGERSERQTAVRQRRDQLFADLDDKEARTVLEKYYQAIDDATTGEFAQEVDWELVDAFVAGLDDSDQKTISDNTGLNGTELEKRYLTEIGQVADEGYFDDLPQFAYERWLVATDRTDGAPATWEEFREQGFQAALKNHNGDVNAANAAVNKWEASYNSKLGEVRRNFRTDNPELGELIRFWGFGGIGASELAELK